MLADRVDPTSERWSRRLFGAALVANVVTELAAGVHRVHTGALYPYRHVDLVPLYPTWVLAIEWTTTAAAGLLMLVRPRPWVAKIALLATLAGLSQRYSNHGALLVIVAAFWALDGAPRAAEEGRPAVGLLRAQILVVYAFSALNKILHGFASGHALENLLGMAPLPARLASMAVIVAEAGLPVALVFVPRLGVAFVVLLHLGFAAFLPNLASFGLTMVSLAVLFVRRA